jgi:ATP-dependent phosphoenolpyruvate carboxykinase
LINCGQYHCSIQIAIYPLLGADGRWPAKKVSMSGAPSVKTINLSATKEPAAYIGICFGNIIENVVYNPTARAPDYDDVSS